MELVAYKEDDLIAVASNLLQHLGGRKIIALRGSMGAGKTTFIRYLAKAMGIEDMVSSPTYGYVNEYESSFYGKVYHFDLYRLDTLDQAYDIGIEEYIYSESLCIIEWPEIISELLPDETVWVDIEVTEEGDRVFRFD
jgi:tRNA threonylcarbamoyladenosine biosynthesis protein TsaE